MTFPEDESGAVKVEDCIPQGLGKHLDISNGGVAFHPGCWIVASVHAMRWLAAMSGHRQQQGVDLVACQVGLCQIDPVIDIDVPHLLGERVGQGFERERRAVGGFQVQGLGLCAFDLGDDQHIETAAGCRRRIDYRAGGLAFDVGAE